MYMYYVYVPLAIMIAAEALCMYHVYVPCTCTMYMYHVYVLLAIIIAAEALRADIE